MSHDIHFVISSNQIYKKYVYITTDHIRKIMLSTIWSRYCLLMILRVLSETWVASLVNKQCEGITTLSCS